MFVSYIKDGDEPEDRFNYVYTTIIVWTISWAGFYYFSTVKDQPESIEYDYIIDLEEDHIRIHTEEGETIFIHPDSLQHFIETDNL